MQEVLAIAIVRPHPDKHAEVVQVLQTLASIMERKRYSRDALYQDERDDRLFNFRYWVSEETRREAQEDPEVHRCWERLAEICTVEQVYERLHKVEAAGQTTSSSQ